MYKNNIDILKKNKINILYFVLGIQSGFGHKITSFLAEKGYNNVTGQIGRNTCKFKFYYIKFYSL